MGEWAEEADLKTEKKRVSGKDRVKKQREKNDAEKKHAKEEAIHTVEKCTESSYRNFELTLVHFYFAMYFIYSLINAN